MVLKLEIQGSKKLLYKLLNTSWLIAFGCLVLCAALAPLRTYIGAAWVLLIASGIAQFVVAQSYTELYDVNGLLCLFDESIKVGDIDILCENLSCVEVILVGYRNQKKNNGRQTIADGSGNTISFYMKKKPKPVTITFLMRNSMQRDVLEQLLKKWEKQGVQVTVIGIDLDGFNPA